MYMYDVFFYWILVDFILYINKIYVVSGRYFNLIVLCVE